MEQNLNDKPLSNMQIARYIRRLEQITLRSNSTTNV